ncbi:hypothetical protein F5Y12DRAFT_722459 [Xylaria sp. FL1777]|nr:hypothetical protein F5Y12DRAFT_722459 [Xylaria sp. FL1777]
MVLRKTSLLKSSWQTRARKRRAAPMKRLEKLDLLTVVKVWPHIRDAHRLVYFSLEKSPEITDALVEKIFETYCELEEDITSP